MSTAADILDEQQDAQMFKTLGCCFINREVTHELWGSQHRHEGKRHISPPIAPGHSYHEAIASTVIGQVMGMRA